MKRKKCWATEHGVKTGYGINYGTVTNVSLKRSTFINPLQLRDIYFPFRAGSEYDETNLCPLVFGTGNKQFPQSCIYIHINKHVKEISGWIKEEKTFRSCGETRSRQLCLFPANVPLCDLIMTQGHIHYAVWRQDIFTDFKQALQSRPKLNIMHFSVFH